MYDVPVNRKERRCSFGLFFWRWLGKSTVWGVFSGWIAGCLIMVMLAFDAGGLDQVFIFIIAALFYTGLIGAIVGTVIGFVLGIITAIAVWWRDPHTETVLFWFLIKFLAWVIGGLFVLVYIWLAHHMLQVFTAASIFFVCVMLPTIYVVQQMSRWYVSMFLIEPLSASRPIAFLNEL